MADIALLVVEEFERRKGLEGERREGEQLSISSCFFETFEDVSYSLEKFGKEGMQFVQKSLEPKSTLGLAAINGFFSA